MFSSYSQVNGQVNFHNIFWWLTLSFHNPTIFRFVFCDVYKETLKSFTPKDSISCPQRRAITFYSYTCNANWLPANFTFKQWQCTDYIMLLREMQLKSTIRDFCLNSKLRADYFSWHNINYIKADLHALLFKGAVWKI